MYFMMEKRTQKVDLGIGWIRERRKTVSFLQPLWFHTTFLKMHQLLTFLKVIYIQQMDNKNHICKTKH